MKTAAAAIALVLATLPAIPALAQDLALADRRCRDEAEEFSPELRIDGCTELIQSGRLVREDVPRALTMRGWAYQAFGALERAVEDYSEAIRLAPRTADPYGWRGGTYVEMGDYPKAVQDLTRALRLEPEAENAGYWYSARGYSYGALGEVDRAIEDLSQAIARFPDEPEYYLLRGSLYDDKADYPAAIEDVSHALQLAPDVAVSWNQLCWTRMISDGDLDQALAECDRALALEPAMAEALDSRGVVHLKRGDWQAAIADFDAAVIADPNQAPSYYGRGLAFMRIGEADLARANMQRAAEIEPTVAETYAGFGLTP